MKFVFLPDLFREAVEDLCGDEDEINDPIE